MTSKLILLTSLAFIPSLLAAPSSSPTSATSADGQFDDAFNDFNFDEPNPEMPLPMPSVRKSLESSSNVDYTVLIKTGDKWFSGTKGQVFIKFGDASGNTVDSFLPTNGHFSTKKLDTFKVAGRQMGEICTITLGHNHLGFFKAW